MIHFSRASIRYIAAVRSSGGRILLTSGVGSDDAQSRADDIRHFREVKHHGRSPLPW